MVIPEGSTVIRAGEYEGRSDLSSVVIPDSVTVIEARAFYCCRNLRSVQLPKNLRVLGDLAFAYCSGIKKLRLPSTLAEVGINPFLGCEIKMTGKSDRYCIYHDLLIEDGKSIVAGLKDVENVIIPDFCETVKALAFRERRSMRRLIMQPFMVSVGCCAFQQCSNLEFVVMPESLEEIGEWAFSECAVQRIDLPDGLRAIGGCAFYACEELRTVTVDKDMDMHHVGPAVFAHCYKLEEFYVRMEEEAEKSRMDSEYYLNRKFKSLWK